MANYGPARTLIELVRDVTRAAPSSAAVVDVDGRVLMTYSDLFTRVVALGVDLREAGVRQHDLVLVSMANGPEMLIAMLATMCSAVSAPMNPQYTAGELHQHADDLKAVAVVAGFEADTAREVAEARGIPCFEVTTDGPLPAPPGRPRFRPEPGDSALVLHTAGTTSRPKQVPLSHANLVAAANNVVASLALTSADRCLNVMPLFHSHGLLGAALSTIAAGGSIVCAEAIDRRYFVQWATDTSATWYTAASTIHQLVLDSPGDYRGFRFMRSASGPLVPQVAEALEARFGAPMIEVYGMTESYQMTANPLPPGERRLGTVGLPTGTEIRIVDAAGTPKPLGEEGEIAVRGPAVFGGYSAPDGANEDAFVDGWFRTGDLGRLDSDGYLTITGRIKEQINRGGEKVSPREVDEALLDHPDIVDAMSFAYPDAMLGEEIGAAVVLRPGASIDTVAVRRFLHGKVAPFKVPRKVLVVDSIPKSTTGKLLRIGYAERHADLLQPQRSTAFELERSAEGDEIEQRLTEMWMELLELQRPPETSDRFFDLGGTSLLTMELVARIEEQFGVDLPVTEVAHTPTLRGMARRIEHLGREYEPSTLLVPYRAEGSDTIVVLIPGAEGMAIGLVGIADALPTELDVYLFDYPGHRPHSSPATSVEDLAEALVDELAALPGEHRVALYGNSLGGWVAFEAARRLATAGCEPSLVAIGDMFSPILNSPTSPTRPSLPRRIGNRLRRARRELLQLTQRRTGRNITSTLTRRDAVFAASQRARRAYRAHQYAGTTLVFVARERAARYGGNLYWDQHVNGPLHTVSLPSGHGSMHIESANAISNAIAAQLASPEHT